MPQIPWRRIRGRAGLVCTLLAAISGVAIASQPTSASATACDSFSADSGDNTIILGEKTSYFWYSGQYWYYGTGDLAVCWEDSDEIWNYEELTGCDTGSGSTEYILVQALAGDDIVAPSTELHICESPYIDTYMNPFDEDLFDFYLYAYMGTGSDRAVGTGNGDKLYSNTYGTFPTNYLPADSAEDVLCGCDGDDSLYGDHDDTDTYEEILHGGPGTDYCNGGQDGNYYDWEHSTCNSHFYASWPSADYGGCDDEPQSYWW